MKRSILSLLFVLAILLSGCYTSPYRFGYQQPVRYSTYSRYNNQWQHDNDFNHRCHRDCRYYRGNRNRGSGYTIIYNSRMQHDRDQYHECYRNCRYYSNQNVSRSYRYSSQSHGTLQHICTSMYCYYYYDY